MRCSQSAAGVETVSAAIYLILTLAWPSVTFGLVWWRRECSPLRGSPRNWGLYAAGLSGALLNAPDSGFYMLYRLMGHDWETLCGARFYAARVAGTVGVAAFTLAFIQGKWVTLIAIHVFARATVGSLSRLSICNSRVNYNSSRGRPI